MRISLAALFCSLLLAQPERSAWTGVYTEQQARRGEELYAKECASCHGISLNGGESAPPLTGGEFLSSWSGLTAGDLFDRIRVSMPADRPGHLSRQQTSDILAHIFSVNQFPTGSSELDTRSEVLKQIRIEATKP
ncbi:MAG: cytochrome c [Acidobacteriia bacterium]|nr:cytochrome c [Terriglobia bacterium]